MRFQTNGLTGMITGSGRVNLLSGQIWLNGSGLDLLRGACPWDHWATAPAGWATQAARAVRPAGPCRIWPEADFQLRNSFSFSRLFYKLQINLNSNQIWISMTSTHTIKYKSTSSLQEKYATAWMQQIIIYFNIYPYRILFFSKIRALQTYLPQNESRPRDSDGSEKKLENSAFNSSSLSQVVSSSVWWLHCTLHILIMLFHVTLSDVSKILTGYSW
jgi:hypothetical protein